MEVNKLLCEGNGEELFITAFEGVLDLQTGQFNFVNAGHEMPFIRQKGQYTPEKIRAGFVLAGMDMTRYRMGTLQMEPGDAIFQYTDGVTEATNANNELYGMERLEELDCPMKAQMQIDVAIDELFSNIARYAYDPLAKADPDVTLSAEERQIGGLGIFMVKKSMDDIKYEYKDGQNILTVEKRL